MPTFKDYKSCSSLFWHVVCMSLIMYRFMGIQVKDWDDVTYCHWCIIGFDIMHKLSFPSGEADIFFHINSYCAISKHSQLWHDFFEVTILYGWWLHWCYHIHHQREVNIRMQKFTKFKLSLSWILKEWQSDGMGRSASNNVETWWNGGRIMCCYHMWYLHLLCMWLLCSCRGAAIEVTSLQIMQEKFFDPWQKFSILAWRGSPPLCKLDVHCWKKAQSQCLQSWQRHCMPYVGFHLCVHSKWWLSQWDSAMIDKDQIFGPSSPRRGWMTQAGC